ncbi:MAG TPA: MFS transporter [Candidatus Acidoferrales bacterium]|jgi:PAT family beta-lactamase induction signal transducer AmpG|nr:MFS transporter [Candidatus Acidoferrales bacterium]
MQDQPPNKHPTDWRHSLASYTDRHVLQVLALGFSSGLPMMLTYLTLSAWLATAGIKRSAIGAFALTSSFYALKFLWSPLIDRLPPPIPWGRRRGWGLTLQVGLVAAILALGSTDPRRSLGTMAILAGVVAFLSASQDIVIDAWRIEILPLELQGPGAAMIQAGYYLGMLASGAGALVIAARFGWFAAYGIMAALLAVSMLTFVLGPEPDVSPKASNRPRAGQTTAWKTIEEWFATAVIGPFSDFMRRPYWLLILLVILDYKLGEGMAAVMSTPLYIAVGFTLNEIAVISKLFGPFTVIVGALVGGIVTVRFGLLRSLIICGIIQALGNLTYVLQAVGGHKIAYLAFCVTAQNVTTGMAGTALVSYISSLCSSEFTATQYALLASLALLGRTVVGSTGGALSEAIGWVPFFLLTTVASLPALVLVWWIDRRGSTQSDRPPTVASLAGERNA